jgi:hypothetical protein
LLTVTVTAADVVVLPAAFATVTMSWTPSNVRPLPACPAVVHATPPTSVPLWLLPDTSAVVVPLFSSNP